MKKFLLVLVLLFASGNVMAAYTPVTPISGGGTNATTAGAALDNLFNNSSTQINPQSFLRMGTAAYAAQNAYCYQCDPIYLSHWRAAVANVKAGIGNANIIMAGDSTTKGNYANNAGSGDWNTLSVPSQLSYRLNTLGIPSQNNYYLGYSSTANDPRVVITGGWGASGGNTVGGNAMTSTTAASITFTPTTPTKTLTVWYLQGTTAGSFTISIDGSVVNTVSGTQASTQLVSTTVVASTLGLHTYSINWVSGTIFAVGFNAYDSTRNIVNIANAGWQSSTAAFWGSGTALYSPKNAISLFSPALTIFNLGINDWNTSEGVSTYVTNMQNIITNAKTVGDCMIVTPTPTISTTTALAIQQTYVTAMYGLATTNGCALIDNFSRWVSYEVTNPLGLYAPGGNGIHPNGAGYGDQTSPIAALLGDDAGQSGFLTAQTVSASGSVTALSFVNTPSTITASATPAISVSSGLQTITLSANATPTIGTIVSGTRLTLEICQPASGGPYTWTWPAAFHGGVTIGTTASTCSIQSFDSFNGTTFVAESTGVINVAP